MLNHSDLPQAVSLSAAPPPSHPIPPKLQIEGNPAIDTPTNIPDSNANGEEVDDEEDDEVFIANTFVPTVSPRNSESGKNPQKPEPAASIVLVGAANKPPLADPKPTTAGTLEATKQVKMTEKISPAKYQAQKAAPAIKSSVPKKEDDIDMLESNDGEKDDRTLEDIHGRYSLQGSS